MGYNLDKMIHFSNFRSFNSLLKALFSKNRFIDFNINQKQIFFNSNYTEIKVYLTNDVF